MRSQDIMEEMSPSSQAIHPALRMAGSCLLAGLLSWKQNNKTGFLDASLCEARERMSPPLALLRGQGLQKLVWIDVHSDGDIVREWELVEGFADQST